MAAPKVNHPFKSPKAIPPIAAKQILPPFLLLPAIQAVLHAGHQFTNLDLLQAIIGKELAQTFGFLSAERLL